MAKKKIYIALNEGINSFMDPATLFNISGKQIKEIGVSQANSFHVKKALRGGHLIKMTEEAYKIYTEKQKKESIINKADSDKSEYIEQLKNQLSEVVEERDVAKKRVNFLEQENSELRLKIESIDDDDDSIDFESMNKAEIKEYINENYELTDEDISKIESLNKQPLIEFAKTLAED